jgi:hypothetical protein
VIKPKHHQLQTADEHAAEVGRIRALQAAVHPAHQPWAASGLAVGDDCPTCGATIAELSAEPLDFELHDGVMLATSVVYVALPCGHSSVSMTGGAG